LVGDDADERADIVGDLPLVLPQELPGGGIERVDAVVRQRVDVVNIMPSLTTGVICCSPSAPPAKIHLGTAW